MWKSIFKFLFIILFPYLALFIYIIMIFFGDRKTKHYNNMNKQKEEYLLILIAEQKKSITNIEKILTRIHNDYLEGSYIKGSFKEQIDDNGYYILCASDSYYDLEWIISELEWYQIKYDVFVNSEEQHHNNTNNNDYSNNYYDFNEYDNKLVQAYKTLGLEETADYNEIKKSFRSLAKKYHPDVSKEPNAEAKFKEVNEAYQLLQSHLNFK